MQTSRHGTEATPRLLAKGWCGQKTCLMRFMRRGLATTTDGNANQRDRKALRGATTMKHIEDAHSDSIVLNIALVNSIRKPVRPAAQADFLAEERGRTKQPFWIVQM